MYTIAAARGASCPTPIPQALDYGILGTLDILADPALMLGEFQAGWRRRTGRSVYRHNDERRYFEAHRVDL
jgi:hypothetical protein